MPVLGGVSISIVVFPDHTHLLYEGGAVQIGYVTEKKMTWHSPESPTNAYANACVYCIAYLSGSQNIKPYMKWMGLRMPKGQRLSMSLERFY